MAMIDAAGEVYLLMMIRFDRRLTRYGWQRPPTKPTEDSSPAFQTNTDAYCNMGVFGVIFSF